VLRRLFLSFLGLLFAGLLAAGWYAYNKGFTHKWRAFVVTEFRKRGVELSLRRLTLDPFRGIVAKEVNVYDNRDRKRTLAVVDEVRLVINYANLFQGRTFIEALDLHDANLDLPINPKNPDGPKVAIRQLSGRLLLPPRQIYLSRLEADFYGVRVTASGRLINPQALTSPDGSLNISLPPGPAERFIEELTTLKFEGAAPQLNVRFSGDLAALDTRLVVEATLWAEKVRRRNYLCENLYLNAGFRDGVASLKQLAMSDDRGALRASGRFDVGSREAALQLHSGLDTQALIRAFTKIPELEETVFYAPPEIDFTTRATIAEPPSFQVLGHVAQAKFAHKSVIFEGLAADFSWDGTRCAVRDVQLTHRSGEIRGDLLQQPNDLRTRLHSTISPQVLAPVLTGRTGEWLRRLRIINDLETPAHVRATTPGSQPLVGRE
jgi:hypothetical protein